MTNLPKSVSDKEYDFGIVVKHSSCVDPNSCFPENDEERQINLARGLWCDVRISKKGTQCSNYGNYLPCMKWDNFRDDSKTPRTRTFLRTTSESLSLEIGEFEINYHCRFEFSNDAVAPSTSTGWENLHTFQIVQGCEEWLTANSKVDIADLFLLSSPEFLSADCDKLEMVKEEVFRKYDVNPLDGILSLEEVRAAYNTHDVDTGYLNYLEMNTTVFTSTRGGLLLSAVMKSPQKPLRCIAVESNDASAVYIRKATYPTSRSGEETTPQQCEIQKAKIDVSWDYAVLPNDSDFQCAYADGRLYQKFNGNSVKQLSDVRPSVGTGDARISLVAQFTFDDPSAPFMSTDGVNGYTKAGRHELTENRVSLEACGEGGVCMHRLNSLETFHMGWDRRPMQASAIMTWISVDASGPSESGGIYWRKTFDATYRNEFYFQYVKSTRSLKGGFIQTLKTDYVATDNSQFAQTPANSISANTWHHVAMTVNAITGLTIFIDGHEKATNAGFDNKMVDFPNYNEKPSLLKIKYALFDDLRIYKGVVSPAMVKAAVSCGRTQGCAALAYANPQSRRTYCVIPTYNSRQISNAFVPPCATALFYTGAAIDLSLTPSGKGILFAFRDTALDEIGFEVLRRSVTGGSASGIYESVVLIDSSLSGCASKFNSITFFDDEAMENPGSVWEYALRTKYSESKTLDQISDSVTVTIPWRGILEGSIFVGGNANVPMRNVRVCAKLSSGISQTQHALSSDNLASFMIVVHSNPSKVASGYQITDGFADTYATLSQDEFVKIDLMMFYEITEVILYFDSTSSAGKAEEASALDVRILDYDNPENDKNRNKGALCKPAPIDVARQKERKYVCVGTKVTSFQGQFVTILQKEDFLIKIAEVYVAGKSIDCPYTSFTDDDGNYEIEILDTSGSMTTKKTHLSAKSYQTEIYDEIVHKNIFHTHEESKISGASQPRLAEAAVVSMEVYDGEVKVPKYADWNKGNAAFRNVRPCKCKDGSELVRAVLDSIDDVYICATLCTECGGCWGFDIHSVSKTCRFTSGKIGGKNAHVGWKHYTFYRKLSTVKQTKMTDDTISSHVQHCLAEAPKDGMCYKYGFDNNIGPMPSWNVESVTNMKGLFKEHLEFNADLSDWDVSKVIDAREMFSDALNFNHHLGEWKLSSSVSTENMFSGATSFQAKFTCASATNGPPNTCALKWKMNKLSFASYASAERSAFENVKVIVTDEVWKSIDTNGDGDLDDTEFARINRLMRYGYAYGTPWLVYPTLEMGDMRSFGIHRPALSTNELENPISVRDPDGFSYVYERKSLVDRLALVPTSKSSLPILTQAWDAWDADFAKNNETIDLSKSYLGPPTSVNDVYLIVSNALTSEPILPQVSSAYAIPFIANNQTRVRFDKPEGREARAFENLVSRIVVNPMRLRGVEQKADLVHEYDKSTPTNEHSVGQIDEESEKEESEYMDNEEAEEEKKEDDEIASLGSSVSSLGSTTYTVGEIAIAHQGLASKEFSDDTAVKINGIVMFEPTRTQDYTCGLPFAKIYAYTSTTNNDDDKDYTHFGTYLSDSSGRFEIGVPANGDYLFVVDGAKQDFGGDHEICYSGETLENIGCLSSDPEDKILSDPDVGDYRTTSYKEVTDASGTENLVFLDTTIRTVDVGLYAGSCDGAQYEDYTLLIMPANGCGAALSVTDTDISKWSSTDDTNIRNWPYAAMDYYIQLDTAPDVSALNIEKIHATKDGANDGATCTAGTEIMQYFRDRNKLVQTLLLLENPHDQATFRYHGYFCSMIYYSNSAATGTTPFHALSDSEQTCLQDSPSAGDLTTEYLIGTTDFERSGLDSQSVYPNKFVSVQIFEAHLTSPSSVSLCSSVPTSGSVSVQIKNSITITSTSVNDCHPNKAPTDDCKFSAFSEDGYVQFGTSNNLYYEISGSDAIPNFVPPYRRAFSAYIERDDGWAITSLNVERELVTLNSKVRGSGTDTSRYSGDTTFYTTTPIRGLVYTVVHDPPGGNSFASIVQGTHVELELGLTKTKALSLGAFGSFQLGLKTGISNNVGTDFGTGYANAMFSVNAENADYEVQLTGGREENGPVVSASTESDNSWDFHITLSRDIESSQDPAVPGRPGDVILGGGVEIVYVKTDVLDVDKTANNCLEKFVDIQWSPREPTTYLLSVFSIESQIIPELEKLSNTLASNTATGEETNVQSLWETRINTAVEDWVRTLEWSAPDFNPEPSGRINDVRTSVLPPGLNGQPTAKVRFDAIATSFDSEESVFEKLTKPKIDEEFEFVDFDDHEGSGFKKARDLYDGLKSFWTKLDSEVDSVVFTQDPNIALHSFKSEAIKNDDSILAGGTADWKKAWVRDFKGSEGSDEDKGILNSVEDEDSFGRAMSPSAQDDLSVEDNGLLTANVDANFSMSDSTLVDASMFGGDTSFGFTGDNGNIASTKAEKGAEEEPVYITFSGGGHSMQFSSSISSNIDSSGESYTFEIEDEVANSANFEAVLFGIAGEISGGSGGTKLISKERAMAWAKYGDLEVTYTLGDADPYDKFVVHVNFDKRFGTPIFQTVGGASKCPGEANTIWRESGLDIAVKHSPGSNNFLVLPSKPALFDVLITNDSPYQEAHIYGLLLTSGDTTESTFSGGNMLDLKFSINGDAKFRPFGDLMHLNDIPSTDSNGDLINTKLTLRVDKGDLSNEYKGIQLKLVSECEWQMSRDLLYRDPISSTSPLDDITWQRECPQISWDETTMNKYLYYRASEATSDVLDLKVMNPNPLNIWTSDKYDNSNTQRMGWDVDKDHLVHPNVEFVRVQFRRPGIGEWIDAWDSTKASANVVCEHSTSGCGLSWNLTQQYFMNGLRDGAWEIRAKLFCSGYAAMAPMSVRGSTTEDNLSLLVDVTPPKPTEIRIQGRLVIVEYTEPVECPQLKASKQIYNVHRYMDCNGNDTDDAVSWTDLTLKYQFRCISDKMNAWTMELPSTAEEGKYSVTIGEATDSTDSYDGVLPDESGNIAAALTFDIDMCSSTGGSLASVASIGVDESELHGAFAVNTPAKQMKKEHNLASLGVSQHAQSVLVFKPITVLLGSLAMIVVASASTALVLARRNARHFSMNPLDETSDVRSLLRDEPPRKPAYGSVL